MISSKNITSIVLVTQIIGLLVITYNIVVKTPMNTEGVCISLILLTILFMTYKHLEKTERIKQNLDKLNQYLEDHKVSTSQNHSNIDTNLKQIIDEIKDIQDFNNDNLHVIDYNLGKLINAIRNRLPIDKEFEGMYSFSMAKRKLNSKSEFLKQQAVLRMYSDGGEKEIKLLIDIIKEPNNSETLKILAETALAEIYTRQKEHLAKP